MLRTTGKARKGATTHVNTTPAIHTCEAIAASAASKCVSHPCCTTPEPHGAIAGPLPQACCPLDMCSWACIYYAQSGEGAGGSNCCQGPPVSTPLSASLMLSAKQLASSEGPSSTPSHKA